MKKKGGLKQYLAKDSSTGVGPVGTKRNVHELLLFGEFDGQMEQKRKIGE